MGNCLRHESPMKWGGDDWGNLDESEKMDASKSRSCSKQNDRFYDKETEVGGDLNTSISCSTEVKIKITKKQLEELLGRVDVQGLPVEQILSQLMNVSEQFQTQHRSWRPALQSIPEVN